MAGQARAAVVGRGCQGRRDARGGAGGADARCASVATAGGGASAVRDVGTPCRTNGIRAVGAVLDDIAAFHPANSVGAGCQGGLDGDAGAGSCACSDD